MHCWFCCGLSSLAHLRFHSYLHTYLPSSDVYRAFLAEIQPQRAIYDLNVERSSLLHVQFLWPRPAQGPSEPSASQAKESRLLVFLHRECEYGNHRGYSWSWKTYALETQKNCLQYEWNTYFITIYLMLL